MIRERARRGESLRREDVAQDDPRLVRAAEKSYGSWRDAAEAAGCDVPGNQRWSPERIRHEIVDLYRRGIRLASSHVDKPLRLAAIAHFGSWRKAIEAAGLDYASLGIRSRRTPEELLELIRASARSGRVGVGPDGAIPTAVAVQARAAFGSVAQAVEAAGLDPRQVLASRAYTERQVIEAVRKLAAERPDMTVSEASTTAVGAAAKRRFRSVTAAAEAAGLSGWPRLVNQPLPSREDVLAGVVRRHRRGASMRLTQVIHADRRLMNGAYKHFGTWRSAVRAAGIDYQEAHWTRRQVIAELRARQLRRDSLTASAIQREDPKLWDATIAFFGSLSAALGALRETRVG